MATFLKKSFVTLLISLSLSQFLFACSNRGEIKSWVNPHPWAHCIANHAVIIAKKTIVPKSWVNNNEVLKDLKDEVLFKLYDALENGTLSAFFSFTVFPLRKLCICARIFAWVKFVRLKKS
jgi:hypothetical protein